MLINSKGSRICHLVVLFVLITLSTEHRSSQLNLKSVISSYIFGTVNKISLEWMQLNPKPNFFLKLFVKITPASNLIFWEGVKLSKVMNLYILTLRIKVRSVIKQLLLDYRTLQYNENTLSIGVHYFIVTQPVSIVYLVKV